VNVENEQVDRKVLGLITNGANTANDLERVMFSRTTDNAQAHANMRVVDKSLQRLRRAGKIAFVKRAWTLVKP
jgi:hypothetical protein